MSASAGVRVHQQGQGHCPACGGNLPLCPNCQRATLHRIQLGPGAGVDFVCERGCSGMARLLKRWMFEMRRAERRVELAH